MRESSESSGDARIVEECARFFGLGVVREWRRHGGTAARNWRVATDRGVWLIRRRGVRTSSPECIAFDHALRRRLLECGVPTAAARAGRGGRTWLEIGGSLYEAYPFIEGIALTEADDRSVRSAAMVLPRFHAAASGLGEMAEALPLPAQYATLGVPDAGRRLEDPVLLERVYGRLAREVGADAEQWREDLEAALQWIARIRADIPDAVYRALPHAVVHGDYTLANLLFDANREVCGVFDFDWARWGPRVRDVADGLFFIAGVRSEPLDPGDIWSLTRPVRLDARRCRVWLAGYEDVSPLTAEERRSLVPALAARWLSVRVEGMAKVPAEARLRFCFGPLRAGLAEIARLDRFI